MDTIYIRARQCAHPVAPARAGTGILALIGRWLARGRSRRQLRLLLTSQHVLADLGLTPEQADVESTKPFWR
jgi:uncharacterized protein YjiS (DUF1127 family)